jgi:hypothetical protein
MISSLVSGNNLIVSNGSHVRTEYKGHVSVSFSCVYKLFVIYILVLSIIEKTTTKRSFDLHEIINFGFLRRFGMEWRY